MMLTLGDATEYLPCSGPPPVCPEGYFASCKPTDIVVLNAWGTGGDIQSAWQCASAYKILSTEARCPMMPMWRCSDGSAPRSTPGTFCEFECPGVPAIQPVPVPVGDSWQQDAIPTGAPQALPSWLLPAALLGAIFLLGRKS